MPKANFEGGILFAAAWLVQQGEPSLAEDLVKQTSVDVSKADEYDAPFLETLNIAKVTAVN